MYPFYILRSSTITPNPYRNFYHQSKLLRYVYKSYRNVGRLVHLDKMRHLEHNHRSYILFVNYSNLISASWLYVEFAAQSISRHLDASLNILLYSVVVAVFTNDFYHFCVTFNTLTFNILDY